MPIYRNVIDNHIHTYCVSLLKMPGKKKLRPLPSFLIQESPALQDTPIMTSNKATILPERQAPFPRADTNTGWHKNWQASRNPIFLFTGSYLRFNKLVQRWHPIISSYINTRDLSLYLSSIQQDFLPARKGKQNYQNTRRKISLLLIQSINNQASCLPWKVL